MFVCLCVLLVVYVFMHEMSHQLFHECCVPHARHLVQALGDPVVGFKEVAVKVFHISHSLHQFTGVAQLVILDRLSSCKKQMY